MHPGRIGRGISSAAAIRAFRKLGFEIDRIRGGHYILRHSDGQLVTIPRHGATKPGLLLNQLKKVNVSWEEFKGKL